MVIFIDEEQELSVFIRIDLCADHSIIIFYSNYFNFNDKKNFEKKYFVVLI